MISTVTTTTIMTITAISLAVSIELIAIITLLIFLVQKEILSFTASSNLNTLGKFLNKILNIAIVPLLLSFAFIVIVKIVEIWR